MSESRSDRIRSSIEAALRPELLEIEDESERHRGHSGWREGGGTHFRLRIVSAAFAGHGRLARHRMVNEILAEELAGGLHALAIEARAPGE